MATAKTDKERELEFADKQSNRVIDGLPNSNDGIPGTSKLPQIS
jgi:hypothetical protein